MNKMNEIAIAQSMKDLVREVQGLYNLLDEGISAFLDANARSGAAIPSVTQKDEDAAIRRLLGLEPDASFQTVFERVRGLVEEDESVANQDMTKTFFDRLNSIENVVLDDFGKEVLNLCERYLKNINQKAYALETISQVESLYRETANLKNRIAEIARWLKKSGYKVGGYVW